MRSRFKVMIELLKWDSEFFRRKIGLLTGDLLSPDAVARELATAEDEGFEYVMCRPALENLAAVRALEQGGFYLTDVGVMWFKETDRYLREAEPLAPGAARLAADADVPRLAREATRLFRLSRFYHDPFFSTADADRLHQAWMANSVSGRAADAVWMIPDSGFVTCKLAKDGCGEVVLIGVWEDSRRRGAGRRLMTAAMTWFGSKGVPGVRVKTQVGNLRAMNFYHRLGFDLQGTGLTMACIVRAAGQDTLKGTR